MRLRIEAILWILRTGAPWRYLPEVFGRWKSVYGRFRAWTESGLWAAVLNALSRANVDNEAVMVDSTAMRVHAHGANPAGGQAAQALERSRSSLSSKIHLACDALGYPLSFIFTGANVSDFDQAKQVPARHLEATAFALMDKGYDSDSIRAYVNQLGSVAVIPRRATVPQSLTLTSICIVSAIASKTSSPASNPTAVSPPSMKNFTSPALPWSLSPASSSGLNPKLYLRDTA